MLLHISLGLIVFCNNDLGGEIATLFYRASSCILHISKISTNSYL